MLVFTISIIKLRSRENQQSSIIRLIEKAVLNRKVIIGKVINSLLWGSKGAGTKDIYGEEVNKKKKNMWAKCYFFVIRGTF